MNHKIGEGFMQREIEVRGLAMETQEWVYGNLLIDMSTGDLAIIQCKDHHIDVQNCKLVHKKTVGQYTGLEAADSNRYRIINGKKEKDMRIFEGDIVLRVNTESSGITNRTKSLITFERGCFVIKRIEPRPFSPPGYSLYDDYQSLLECEGYFEVIGNIHDTPELLGRDKEENIANHKIGDTEKRPPIFIARGYRSNSDDGSLFLSIVSFGHSEKLLRRRVEKMEGVKKVTVGIVSQQYEKVTIDYFFKNRS
jgi:hypothetical protein